MSVGSPLDDEALEAVSERLGRAQRRRGWRLATAESCTGGLVGHVVTAIAGASDYYAGGAICYEDKAKEDVLGVPHELIVEHGAVSSPIAAAMADGVRQRFGVEVGVSVTRHRRPRWRQPRQAGRVDLSGGRVRCTTG